MQFYHQMKIKHESNFMFASVRSATVSNICRYGARYAKKDGTYSYGSVKTNTYKSYSDTGSFISQTKASCQYLKPIRTNNGTSALFCGRRDTAEESTDQRADHLAWKLVGKITDSLGSTTGVVDAICVVLCTPSTTTDQPAGTIQISGTTHRCTDNRPGAHFLTKQESCDVVDSQSLINGECCTTFTKNAKGKLAAAA